MFHRVANDVMPPALIAGFTTWLSWLAQAPWLGILGLAVSAGWLALGWAKHTGWGADRFAGRRNETPKAEAR